MVETMVLLKDLKTVAMKAASLVALTVSKMAETLVVTTVVLKA